MARYTLKTFYGTEQIERFDHRSVDKLKSILSHPRHDRAGAPGRFGAIAKNPDRFEIFDSLMEKLHNGNLAETFLFIKTIK